jgi:hypothetical protein
MDALAAERLTEETATSRHGSGGRGAQLLRVTVLCNPDDPGVVKGALSSAREAGGTLGVEVEIRPHCLRPLWTFLAPPGLWRDIGRRQPIRRRFWRRTGPHLG